MPVSFTTVPFQTQCRAAAVSLLTAYAADVSLRLQIYPGRPRSIYAPCAYVEGIDERLVLTGPRMRDRSATVRMKVLHGLFDAADTVAQRDAFVDGFVDWIYANPHAADAASMFGDEISLSDDPAFVPDWLRPEDQRQFFATDVEVLATIGG